MVGTGNLADNYLGAGSEEWAAPSSPPLRGTGGISGSQRLVDRLYTCLDWHRAWQHGNRLTTVSETNVKAFYHVGKLSYLTFPLPWANSKGSGMDPRSEVLG